MKRALVAAFTLSLFTVPAIGQQPGNQKGGKGGEPTPEQFQEGKQKLLERIDSRIQMLQQAKSCVQQAQNREQLRACRPEGGEKGGG